MKFYCHAYPNPLIEGVRFNNHYAETSDPYVIEALRKSPLAVEVETSPVTHEPEDDKPNYEEMTVSQLRSALKDRGVDAPNRLKKDDLIALLERVS